MAADEGTPADSKPDVLKIRIEPAFDDDGGKAFDLPADATVRMSRDTFKMYAVDNAGAAALLAADGKVDEHEVESILDKPSLFKKLRWQRTLENENRFHDIEKIGEGATAYVYALKDINCEREVAVKILKDRSPKNLERFVMEGSVIAKLEHPNIIPIYELDVDENGRAYLCMRRVRGQTLKDYLAETQDAAGVAWENRIEDLLNIFLKACDALSYAHSRNCPHQDIKPENILVGEFGEVFLIDWGASSSADELTLTPMYMSPQQASGKLPAASDDIYCLGATLFHCLTQRFPTSAKSLEELFEKKRNGVVDPLPEDERKQVPAPLLAITLKAMDPDPAQRYNDIREFATDLRNYQAGLSVSAYPDGLLDYIRRGCRRHKHTLASIAAVLTVVLVFGAILYQMKLKEIAEWGQPIYTEDFEDRSWTEHWVETQGRWKVENGRLITDKGPGFTVMYNKELPGNIAMEFEGEILPDNNPGDLSFHWREGVEWEIKDGRKTKIKSVKNSYILQTGAWDNSFAMINQGSERLDYAPLELESGRKYKMRIEIDGVHLRLFIDGDLICSHERIFPATSGYVGIYGWYSGKAFDNVRIYSKGVAEKVPITTVGDNLFQLGSFEEAARQYQEVIDSAGSRRLQHEATYKRGLALYRWSQVIRKQLVDNVDTTGKPLSPAARKDLETQARKNREEAYAIWKTLFDTRFEQKAKFHFRQRLFDQGKHEELQQGFERDADKANPELRRELGKQWARFASNLTGRRELWYLPRYLQTYDAAFAEDPLHDFLVARCYLHLDRFEDILKRFPSQRWACGTALLQLGRYEQLLRDYPRARRSCATAMLRLGRVEQALDTYRDYRQSVAWEMLKLGFYGEIITLCPDVTDAAAIALMRQGKAEDALSTAAKGPRGNNFTF